MRSAPSCQSAAPIMKARVPVPPARPVVFGIEVQDARAVDFAQRRFAPRDHRIHVQPPGCRAAAETRLHQA
jgi:hypothetical protein